jgi:K+-sensing histidine kinase KdpD
MGRLKATAPIAVSVAMTILITPILSYVKLTAASPQHLVFFYLFPVAVVAVGYGSRAALFSAAAAFACASYFLYDPVYSFYVSNRLEFGELICFALLATLGIKCTTELMRPSKNAAPRSRYGQP